jgi:chromosome partitioning protein
LQRFLGIGFIINSTKNEGKLLHEDALIEAKTLQGPQTTRAASHVIVVGNEKGGAGKTTVCMHIKAALEAAGKSVGTIDLDLRQRSLTRYMENRTVLAGRRAMTLSEHVALDGSKNNDLEARQAEEADTFVRVLGSLRARHDFVIVDCPGNDSYLSRLAHASADTLITPMNESFVDLDLLARIDPETLAVKSPSIYAEMVWSCRQARAQAQTQAQSRTQGTPIDWIVLRNRTSHIHAKNRQRVEATLKELGRRLNFREVEGLSERVVFREMFPAGLTLLDLTDEEAGQSLTMSHVAARAEVMALVKALNLPGMGAPTGRDV